MRIHKGRPQLLVCKATRLLNIILHYEKGDADYLEYEIRSYKRFFRSHHKLTGSETLLLKFIKTYPDKKRKKIPESHQKKMQKEINALQKDRHERQLLKYFDFTEWITSRG